MVVLAAALIAPAAQADRGLTKAFGEYGPGASQFLGAGPVAVDPTDGNAVYTLSKPEGSEAFLLRKYDTAGNLLGTAEIPGGSEAGGVLITASALAVDGSEHRVYVLTGGRRNDPTNSNAATREILAYSTIPNGAKELTFAPGVASGVLHDFRTEGGYMYRYTGFAVDPSTHKLVVLGEPTAGEGIEGLRYITDTGALSTLVPDVTTAIGGLAPSAVIPALSMAIGPDGTVYLNEVYSGLATNAAAVFSLQKESATATQLLVDPNSPVQVASITGVGATGIGNSIAVSPDGSTLFVNELPDAALPGRVRAYSTTTGKGVYLYEGGDCGTSSPGQEFGLAAGSGGFLATTGTGSSGEPGESVIHLFGEAGTVTACPSNLPPVPTITVEGQSGPAVSVNKGETLPVEIGAAVLRGFAATKLEWDLDGDGTYETTVTDGSLGVTHKFVKAGTYQIGVKLTLEDGQESAPTTQTVTVIAPTPTASFKVSNKAPAPGAAVTFDAEGSIDPAGSPTAEPTHELATYKWDFGDGTTAETHTAQTTHAFANAAETPLARTVKLIVVSKDGVSSTAVQQTLTVAGTPATDTPVPTPTPTPTPTPVPTPIATPTKPAPVVCKKTQIKKQGKCVKKPVKKKHGKKHGKHKAKK